MQGEFVLNSPLLFSLNKPSSLNMLNRRHIRIKVMQSLYAYQGSESDDFSKEERFLLMSLDSMYDLYLSILALLTELQKKSKDYNIKVKNTHLSNASRESSAIKFEKNKVLLQITNNAQLQNAIAKRKLNFWDLDFEYVDMLFKAIKKSALYKDYVRDDAEDYNKDKQFIVELYATIIATDEKLYEYFEDKRLTWIDDLPTVNTVLVKLLKKINPRSPETYLLPNLYRDEEDREFGKELFKKTLLNSSVFSAEIADKTKNWDAERLASIDGVLLKMALCEFQKFPSIPHKVTINECLEIAKEYSTPKSSVFINGILDRLVKEYQAQGLYPKSGRGLM